LEEEFAARIDNDGPQGGESCDPGISSFEGGIEDAKCSKACGIGMLLIIWVQDIDENSKELQD